MSEQMILPVSSVVQRVKQVLEAKVSLKDVWIQGEISNLTKHRSGHYYFLLKDESSAIRCIMFSSYVQHLKFDVEEGMKVLVKASVNVYSTQGTLQLNVTTMKPDGIGALYLELEQRKKRLSEQGFFDESHKTAKPEFIANIAIITAKEGAAIQDVVTTIRKRWPMMNMRIYPTLVQGSRAASMIITQLQRADEVGYDAILLVRGGGSFEDLFCFNDEDLVKAIYQCRTYTVSGVGHEVDTTLCDLVADHRSVTPTAAAQWVSLNQRDVYARIESFYQQLSQRMGQLLMQNQIRLKQLQSHTYLSDPKAWIIDKRLKLDTFENQLDQSRESILRLHSDIQYVRQMLLTNIQQQIAQEQIHISNERDRLDASIKNYRVGTRKQFLEYMALLDAYSPLKVLTRGYSITQHEDEIVHSVDDVKVDDVLTTRLRDGLLYSKIMKKESKNDKETTEIS